MIWKGSYQVGCCRSCVLNPEELAQSQALLYRQSGVRCAGQRPQGTTVLEYRERQAQHHERKNPLEWMREASRSLAKPCEAMRSQPIQEQPQEILVRCHVFAERSSTIWDHRKFAGPRHKAAMQRAEIAPPCPAPPPPQLKKNEHLVHIVHFWATESNCCCEL